MNEREQECGLLILHIIQIYVVGTAACAEVAAWRVIHPVFHSGRIYVAFVRISEGLLAAAGEAKETFHR